jgi:hypothetical protein
VPAARPTVAPPLPSQPAAPPTPTTTAPPAQTFGSRGGVVTVSCNGTAIELLSATPTNGYSINVDSSGPVEVRVHFSSSQSESMITANCQTGTPVGQVYEDS